MNLKFDRFFKKKKDDSPCVMLPTINKGSIQINNGGCYGKPQIKVTLPHVSVDDKKTAEEIAKKNTYTF